MAGTWDESAELRRALVNGLGADGMLHSPRVAAALEAVPRELFVPGVSLDEAYRPSEAIVVKRVDGVAVSSASAPEVVALMLEQLDPRPGDRVLEIGAGTGYNAALLAHLVGDSGQVVTLDIDADLVQGARDHLKAAGFSGVEVVEVDGAIGSRDDRVFDRIILTVSSSDIAPAWRDQLAPEHGRLVMPLSLCGPQRSVAFKTAGDHLVSDSVRTCSFIPLRGLLASASQGAPHAVRGACVLTGLDDEPLGLPDNELGAVLRAPARIWSSGVSSSLKELREGLHLWLVTHVRGMGSIWGGGHVPDLLAGQEATNVRGTLCLLDARQRQLAMLAWADPSAHAGELVIQASIGADELVQRVFGSVQQWDRAGRPLDADVQIRAYRRTTSPPLSAHEIRLERRWTDFVLSWNCINRPRA